MSTNGTAAIYTIRHGDGEYLLPVDPNDYESLVFTGRPRGASWRPIRMRRLKWIDGQLQKPTDFPNGPQSTYLAMTLRAREKIGQSINKYGEFLPLRCDDGNFWAFHVTHFMDALDENASSLLRASDDPNMVLMIHKHVFRPERLTPDWMFKLPQSRGRGPIYVTDPFVNLINASGHTGLRFKRVWPHS